MAALAFDRGKDRGNSASNFRVLCFNKDASELVVDSEANIMGKLGEFGQGIIKRKADGIMMDFGKNLSRAVEAG